MAKSPTPNYRPPTFGKFRSRTLYQYQSPQLMAFIAYNIASSCARRWNVGKGVASHPAVTLYPMSVSAMLGGRNLKISVSFPVSSPTVLLTPRAWKAFPPQRKIPTGPPWTVNS
ncbi:hypothetical protein SAY86_023542 [Trapa natans]|uniref:Uncharacterized protein n=1 Tax=Trapa natans TaxID=22666 RepID=A0AAN7LV37_TRANT|nr:hypothetical protein SAY86_023542 [Trapa natans]